MLLTGLGYYTTEELVYDEEGQLMTNRSWFYKPPGAKDIPINFRIKFTENSKNAVGVLKSKGLLIVSTFFYIYIKKIYKHK